MAMEDRTSDSMAAKKIQENCNAMGKTSEILARILEFQPDTLLG